MRREIFGATLATIAREEVMRRVTYLGKNIAGFDEAKANAAIVNFQAWSALADWFAHGFTRYVHIYGGTNSDHWIDWTTLEEAAAKELKALEEKLEKAGSRGEHDGDRQSPEALAELHRRRDCLFMLASIVGNHRRLMDETAAEIRASIAAGSTAAEKVAA